jgi:hypothetical protein
MKSPPVNIVEKIEAFNKLKSVGMNIANISFF